MRKTFTAGCASAETTPPKNAMSRRNPEMFFIALPRRMTEAEL
jgi:hypothetical protein